MSLYVDIQTPFFLSYSGNQTITPAQFRSVAHLIQTGADKTITLPSPTGSLANHSVLISNNGSAGLTIACTDGFLRDADSVALTTGNSCLISCRKLATNTYRYVVV